MTRGVRIENSTDRRSGRRFAIEQRLYYRRCGEGACARGKTVDISSSGVQFTTESALNPGQLVELSMNWPALLGGGCPLKLHMLGYVVRSGPQTAAVKIMRYEFRTRRDTEAEVSDEAEDLQATPENGQKPAISFGRRSWLSGSSN